MVLRVLYLLPVALRHFNSNASAWYTENGFERVVYFQLVFETADSRLAGWLVHQPQVRAATENSFLE